MYKGKGGPRASRARPLWALLRPALTRPELMAGLLQELFGSALCCSQTGEGLSHNAIRVCSAFSVVSGPIKGQSCAGT